MTAQRQRPRLSRRVHRCRRTGILDFGLGKDEQEGAKYVSLSFKLKDEPPAKTPAFNDSVEF